MDVSNKNYFISPNGQTESRFTGLGITGSPSYLPNKSEFASNPAPTHDTVPKKTGVLSAYIPESRVQEGHNAQTIREKILSGKNKGFQIADPHIIDQITQGKNGHEHGHGDEHQHEHEHGHHHYNPLKIPADWEFAKKHALARRVAKEKNLENAETCPCCGYEVDRELIPYFASPMQLNFLGSGFPLFYNFIIYCIFILFELLTIKGGYNLVTNIMGNYCLQQFGDDVPAEKQCPPVWTHIVSLANKSNKPEQLHLQEYLGLIVIFVVMITLMFFRASQKKIDVDIDASICSPSDYTICVKNIPKGLNADYKKEIKNIFTNYAVPQNMVEIVVKKIVLVHDIEEIIELEKQLDHTVKAKQNHLHENYCNFNDPGLHQFDEKIEEIEHEIHKIEKELKETNSKFTGIAFVSFQTEEMKQKVLENNPWTTYERYQSYMNNGKLPDLKEDVLAWQGQKLFIEQAPEPNDVDWEFIHIPTKQKIIVNQYLFYQANQMRIVSNLLSLLFMVGCFLILYAISLWKAELSDQANEQAKKGEINQSTLVKINVLSFVISWIIVIFNKFVIGKVLHYIVDEELISNKTKFNISYAHKLSVALFLNTAGLSYIIDIVILKNIIGQGGFIQNETQVFMLNAIFPPLVWLLDPWSIQKNLIRTKEMQDPSQSIVTQQEANFICEQPDYLQSKRYSDIMKTMWFTFLYGSAIPLGIVFSMFGLTIYYYIDKYNVLRRRTIKENLGKALSIEMIEMLELIILFNGFGSLTMSYNLFGEVHWQDLAILLISIIYCVMPMQEIAESIFQIEEVDEVTLYDDAEVNFDTDYDRENPVTKMHALQRWKELAEKRKKKLEHQYHHQVEYDEQEQGYERFFQ